MFIDVVIYEDWIYEFCFDICYFFFFEGYCENFGVGRIIIEFWVGVVSGCIFGNVIIGWGLVFWILVEEVLLF